MQVSVMIFRRAESVSKLECKYVWLHRVIASLIAIQFFALVPNAYGTSLDRPEIWLAPLHPNDRAGGLGAADYFALFDSSSPWRIVASHVTVFQIFLDLLRRESDETLRRVFDGLAARHIDLAVEMPVLVDTAKCEQGTKETQWMAPLIAKLKRLGGKLRYVVMVGPLVDGHTYTRDNYCHSPIPEVAADAARTIRAIREIYPDVIVGETEPVGSGADFPDWSELPQWFDAFRRASGRGIAFIHMDVTWGLAWRDDLLDVARQARASGMKFGVIYDGDGSELSSGLAAQNVGEHEKAIESLPGMPPDQVIFETWFSYPDHVLPERDPTSMTGMVFDYLLPHTNLKFVNSSQAQLLDSQGAPISGAPLILEAHKALGSDGLVGQRIDGTVPVDARSALFAVRIHTECECEQRTEAIDLADFTYSENAQPEGTAFSWNMNAWTQHSADASKGIEVRVPPVILLKTRAGEKLALNSPSFAVTAGSHFDAQFVWNVDAESENTGYATLIFLGANGNEVHRVLHYFRETFERVITLRSDRNGFARLPGPVLAKLQDAKLVFRGDSHNAGSETRLERSGQ